MRKQTMFATMVAVMVLGACGQEIEEAPIASGEPTISAPQLEGRIGEVELDGDAVLLNLDPEIFSDIRVEQRQDDDELGLLVIHSGADLRTLAIGHHVFLYPEDSGAVSGLVCSGPNRAVNYDSTAELIEVDVVETDAGLHFRFEMSSADGADRAVGTFEVQAGPVPPAL